MSYQGVGKTCFHDVSILSGNEKSNTGQSDRSNRMIGEFLLAHAVFPGNSRWASRQNRTHSIREIFFCSLRKTFGHLSDRAKKIEIDKTLTLEHYTTNKVFVSPCSCP